MMLRHSGDIIIVLAIVLDSLVDQGLTSRPTCQPLALTHPDTWSLLVKMCQATGIIHHDNLNDDRPIVSAAEL